MLKKYGLLLILSMIIMMLGTNKYVVAKWRMFEIVDDKPIMDQIH